MKKTILAIITGILVIGFSLPAQAADLLFSPSSINIISGQDFNLNLSIDPKGTKIYTVKTQINFPADLLEIKSFNFGSGWMQLNQVGYDSIDNANGILIKTAGYAGGIASGANFGTITFSAKKDGNGTISANGASLALDADSKNNFSGLPAISFSISKPVSPVPSPSPKPALPIISPSANPTIPASPSQSIAPSTAPETETPNQTLIESPAAGQQNLAAGIGNIISFGTGNAILGTIVALMAISLAILVILEITRRKKRNKDNQI